MTHGLKLNARALVPLVADRERSAWLVGTNALRDENEVHYCKASTGLLHKHATVGNTGWLLGNNHPLCIKH